VTIGLFLFDGPARLDPFFDGPHTGRAKTGQAGPFVTPNFELVDINVGPTKNMVMDYQWQCYISQLVS